MGLARSGNLWLLAGVLLGAQVVYAQPRRPVPPLRLGAVSESTGFDFSGIAGVVRLRDGSLAVLDRRERAVYRVRLGGHAPVPLTRAGHGPGEVVQPWYLLSFRADSLLLWDLTARRFTVLAPTGQGARTIAPPSGFGGIVPKGVDGSGRIYFEPALTAATDSVPVRRWNPESSGTDSLFPVDAPDIITTRRVVDGRRVVANHEWPGGYRDEWGVAGGAVVVLRSRPFRLERWTGSARTFAGPDVPYEPVVMTEEEREGFGAGMRTGVKPPFVAGQLLIADDGTFLIEEQVRSGVERSYLLIGGTGEPAARMAVPRESRIVGISATHLLVVQTNRDGLQRIVTFARDALRSLRGAP